MRLQIGRTLAVIGLAAGLTAPAAEAQLFTSWNACGGNIFNTCASVELSVTGTVVTVRTRNLSGLNGTYANTVFTGIGFEWADPGMALVAANDGGYVDSMTGTTLQNKNGTDPDRWRVHNDTQIGGGINLDMVGTTDQGNVDDGIVSDLYTAGGLPGGQNNFWVSGEDAGWVTFSFTVLAHSFTQAQMNGTSLLVKGQNGPGGQSTQLIVPPQTVVPEPVSMALLGSGLMGLGYVRRRRRERDGKQTDLDPEGDR